MRVWRICPRRFADAAFQGEGARLYAGRWNPVGVPMVYTATSLPLAALEFFVHLELATGPSDLVSIRADVPVDESSVQKRGQALVASLPADWRRLENLSLREIGAEWIADGQSLAMMVPSVVIDGEWNVLINPAHEDFPNIRLEEPKPFGFDPRMFRGRDRTS